MKKKIFSILFALVLVLSFGLVTAVPAAADGTYLGTPPTIDGDLSEWEAAGAQYIYADGCLGGEQIGTGKLYIAFDNDNFYLAYNLEDAGPGDDYLYAFNGGFWFPDPSGYNSSAPQPSEFVLTNSTLELRQSWSGVRGAGAVYGEWMIEIVSNNAARIIRLGSMQATTGLVTNLNFYAGSYDGEDPFPGSYITDGVDKDLWILTGFSDSDPHFGQYSVAAPPVTTIQLFAGQTIDVGTVSVWDDGTDLYVKYETTGDWVMTETHLHVATSLDGIPQTEATGKGKNIGGNPIPGQFDYKMEHDPPVAEYTYTIPLDGWDIGTNLFIAAQAEVQRLSDVIMATLATGAGTDNVLVIAEDTSNLGHPIGYPGPYDDTPTSSIVIQGTSAAYSGWPTITGAQWISDSLGNPGSANTWRLFTRSFSLPPNATNISGTLQINSDNAEEVKLNDNVVGSYGEVYGAFTDNQEWKTKLSYSVTPIPGDNTLEVMVRNYYWVPTPDMWNYTGLVYKMDYQYQLLFTETAWAGTEVGQLPFDGKNWATYFTYTVSE